MTDRQRQPRPTSQDLTDLSQRLRRVEAKQDLIIGLLAAKPPAAPKLTASGDRFYPGSGVVLDVGATREWSAEAQAVLNTEQAS